MKGGTCISRTKCGELSLACDQASRKVVISQGTSCKVPIPQAMYCVRASYKGCFCSHFDHALACTLASFASKCACTHDSLCAGAEADIAVRVATTSARASAVAPVLRPSPKPHCAGMSTLDLMLTKASPTFSACLTEHAERLKCSGAL